MIGCPKQDHSVIKLAWSKTHLHTLLSNSSKVRIMRLYFQLLLTRVYDWTILKALSLYCWMTCRPWRHFSRSSIAYISWTAKRKLSRSSAAKHRPTLCAEWLTRLVCKVPTAGPCMRLVGWLVGWLVDSFNAQSSLVVTHPSADRGWRALTLVNVPLRKTWSPPWPPPCMRYLYCCIDTVVLDV